MLAGSSRALEKIFWTEILVDFKLLSYRLLLCYAEYGSVESWNYGMIFRKSVMNEVIPVKCRGVLLQGFRNLDLPC